MRRRPTYDPEADAIYIPLSDARPVEAEEVAPNVILDFDAENRVVGIEVLSASRKLAPGAWTNWPLPGVDNAVPQAAE